jgi:hypothetical protein
MIRFVNILVSVLRKIGFIFFLWFCLPTQYLVPIVQEADLAPGPVWAGVKKIS